MVRRHPINILCRNCIRGVGLCVLWLLWLVLIAGIVLQARLYFTQTIFVPDFALRRLEERLSNRGFDVRFDSLQLDKGGNITVHRITAKPNGGPGPEAHFERVDLKVSPWLALAGFLEPTSVRVEGGRIVLPAILSPTGMEEPLVESLALDAEPIGERWRISLLQGRIRGAYVTVSGSLPDFNRFKKSSSPSSPSIAPQRSRAQLWRRIAQTIPLLERIRGATMDIQLGEEESSGLPRVDMQIAGEAVVWPLPTEGLGKWAPEVSVQNWELSASAPLDRLLEVPIPIVFSAAKLSAGDAAMAELVRVDTQVDFAKGSGPVNDVQIEAASIAAKGLRLESPHLHLQGQWPNVSARLAARLAGKPVELTYDGDATQRSGDITVESVVSKELLELIDKLTGRSLAVLLQPSRPAPIQAQAKLGTNGQVERVTGWLSSGPVVVRGVALESASGEMEYEGRSLRFQNINLTAADSHAHGSYEMDTGTRRFRFLLAGELRPPAIAGWFSSWWPRFWTTFDFKDIPTADIDIQGAWGDVSATEIFLSATAENARVLGAPFDHVFTTLYVRPQYFDVQWMHGKYGEHRVTGSFDRAVQARTNALASMRFDVRSDLPFDHYRTIFKEDAENILKAFTFDRPPLVHAHGIMRGPADPTGTGRALEFTVESDSKFTLFEFPLEAVRASGRVEGTRITLPQASTGFAGGNARGNVIIDGPDEKRTVQFEGRLESANLGRAIATLEAFSNRDTPRPTVTNAPSRFQRQIADGNLNLTVSASGLGDDPYSFQGSGLASISGAKLAEINLLGQLSQALKSIPWLNFTSFALDDVESKFRLDRNMLRFDAIKVTGPSAHITAHGQYDLRAKSMGVDAAFYPFGQRRNFLGSAMDLVLTPLSSALEMRLEGTLDNPKWHFVLGPTSLLRRMGGSQDPRPTSPQNSQTPQPAPLLRRQ